jgi:hypothetical protein
VEVVLDGACGITISPVLDNSRVAGLTTDDTVLTYVNTDDNPQTGDMGLGGADSGVAVRDGFPPTLFFCTTTPCDRVEGTDLAPFGVAGFATDLNQLRVQAPTTLGISVEADYAPPSPGLPDVDFAPDMQGVYGFEADFSLPTPEVPALPKPQATFPSVPNRCHQRACFTDKRCIVPNVKGKSVRKARKALRRAGCRFKVKGKGTVVSTRPKAGTQTRDIVQVKAKTRAKRILDRRRCHTRRCRSKRLVRCHSRSCYTHGHSSAASTVRTAPLVAWTAGEPTR